MWVRVQPRLDGGAGEPRHAEPLTPADREEGALEVLGSPSATTSPNSRRGSARSPTTTARAKPTSTSAGPSASPPRNPTKWTLDQRGTSWPRASATPSSNHPGHLSPPPRSLRGRSKARSKPDTAKIASWLVTDDKRGNNNDGDHHAIRRAPLVPRPDCNGVHGRDCLECRGEGRYIRRACALCGDPGWDYINGTNDGGGMTCRISCGYRWTASDPGWGRSAPEHHAGMRGTGQADRQ